MSESWDEHADGWDTNQSVVEYSQLAFESLKSQCELSGLRVMDFGCGTGLLAEQIAKQASSVLAVDTSAKMIEVLNNKNMQQKRWRL